MIKTFVFVSYELAPINAGGCGVFIHNALQELLKDSDNHIVLLLDMPKYECEQYENEYKPQLPNNKNLKIVCLSEILKGDVGCGQEYDNIFLQKSYRFYKGLLLLCEQLAINYIEFFDYVGIGYFAIRAKRFEGEFENIILSVRAHCTIDLMDIEQIPNEINLYKIEMYQMEKDAIRHADYVMAPSNSWSQIYMQRYDVKQESIIVSPPPVKNWDDVEYILNEKQQDVLFYGRIFQLKGVDVFIDAAVLFISKNSSNNSIFYLVGYDGFDMNGTPYRNQLIERIPEEFRKRFVFTGQLDHKKLEKILCSVRFAVFPNLVESFCYSIHELYGIGVPIISNNIPAFNDYFQNEKNALVYDGTSYDLVAKMEKMLNNADLRKQISSPFKVTNNKLFNISYTNVFKKKSIEHINNNLSWKCSLIVLQEEDFSTQYLSILEHTDLDLEKSYILSNSSPGVPVSFLGKIRYAKRLDGVIDYELPLMPYVLTCYASDIIDPIYITKAKKVFSLSQDIHYVGCYYRNEVGYTQYDLYKNHIYRPYNNLSRSIVYVNAKSANIRDIFDNRFAELGELNIINKEGYVIPDALLAISKTRVDVHREQFVYRLHKTTENTVWNPFILFPYINEPLIVKNYNENEETTKKLKKTYHKIKVRVDKWDGKRVSLQ